MRYFKNINYNPPYPTQVQIGEFDPLDEEYQESADTLYCPVWEWSEDPETDDIIPGSKNHDWVSVNYDFVHDRPTGVEEITQEEFDRLSDRV